MPAVSIETVAQECFCSINPCPSLFHIPQIHGLTWPAHWLSFGRTAPGFWRCLAEGTGSRLEFAPLQDFRASRKGSEEIKFHDLGLRTGFARRGHCQLPLGFVSASGFVWNAEGAAGALQSSHRFFSGGSLSIGNPDFIPYLISAG